eukprot:15156659-Alexandrium_andersonii.AAC.1
MCIRDSTLSFCSPEGSFGEVKPRYSHRLVKDGVKVFDVEGYGCDAEGTAWVKHVNSEARMSTCADAVEEYEYLGDGTH